MYKIKHMPSGAGCNLNTHQTIKFDLFFFIKRLSITASVHCLIIDHIIQNIRARFSPNTLALLDSFSIFDIQNVTNEADYGDRHIAALQQHYKNDFDHSLSDEWKTFRKYLLLQKNKDQSITQRDMCIKLIKDGTLKEVYPQLSLLAEIFLYAPISTATVERDFSTTNRILTDLRNRLTTEHVDQLMRISIEEPEYLNAEIK